MANKRIRIIVDIAMTFLLPMLMAYSLIGEKFHEFIGTLMFVLFILHHVLNRKWYGSLFTPKRTGETSGGRFYRKGKYNARRIFQTVLDVLLIVFMLAQPISGILMSKHLYTFIQIPGISAAVREIHLCLAYWGFVLLCIHAGMHLTAPIKKLRKHKAGFCMAIVAATAVSLYGIYAFIKRQFPDYMLHKTAFVFFDYSEPKAMFFLDYLAIMILFMLLGCLVAIGLTCLNRRMMKKGGESK